MVTKSLEEENYQQINNILSTFLFLEGGVEFCCFCGLPVSPVNWDITAAWWDRCQACLFYFFFSLENAPKAAAYQGLCPRCLITALSTDSPPPVLLLGWKLGLSWKSLLGQTWGSPSVLSLLLPVGSAALQPAQNIQVKWGQKLFFFFIFNQNALRGNV